MDGATGASISGLADKFNSAQSAYKLVPVFKGSYDESMAAAIAAIGTAKAPHLLQVAETGTAAMLTLRKGIKPVYEVMAQAGEKFDAKDYIPAVGSYFSDTRGRMLSLPFNNATPVLYFNKVAFTKAGLDPSNPPKTWDEMEAATIKVTDAGMACGFTTGSQSWVQLENMSAWHHQEFATKANGYLGLGAKLVFNSQIMLRHVAKLSSWAKSRLFDYAGRRNEAEAKFYNGDCALLTGSSSAYAGIKRSAKFEFGVAQLPYYEDVKDAPQNTIVDGSSLWVVAGKKSAEYKGVAKFLSFLSSPAIQAEWHQQTGYLPITKAAYELSRTQGYYDANPGADIAIRQLLRQPVSDSRGIRLGNFAQIRDIVDEELEAVWSHEKGPKQALDEAVERGNEELRKFERGNVKFRH